MMTRRNLFRTLIGILTATLLPVGRVFGKKMALPLDMAPKLKEVGGWVILKIKEEQILFIRDSLQTVRALSPICTHKKCLVAYNPSSGRIECPCHKSAYDLAGKVLAGPAPAPLRSFSTTLEQDRIILSMD